MFNKSSSSSERIRIGIVGAGANTRARHIPGLKAIPGVEIVSVANRTVQSAERVAKEFEIPKVYENWMQLVEADDTDAIVIGTWPVMHCLVTLEALECNKHVMCEARMGMNAGEAHAMLDAARRRPHLVAQVVPAPFTLPVDATIQRLIAEGYLGEILAVELLAMQSGFIDKSADLHWRQDVALSGFNTMTLGIWYESLMRWVGPAARVSAMSKVFVPTRKDSEGRIAAIAVPDHVDVLAQMTCGAAAHMRFSAVTGHAPANEVWLFGSEGTLRLDVAAMKLYGGRRNDKELSEVIVPDHERVAWRVEEEFINAIGGRETITRSTFEDGVRYMEFTEAVIRSAQSGQAIGLPL